MTLTKQGQWVFSGASSKVKTMSSTYGLWGLRQHTIYVTSDNLYYFSRIQPVMFCKHTWSVLICFHPDSSVHTYKHEVLFSHWRTDPLIWDGRWTYWFIDNDWDTGFAFLQPNEVWIQIRTVDQSVWHQHFYKFIVSPINGNAMVLTHFELQ